MSRRNANSVSAQTIRHLGYKHKAEGSRNVRVVVMIQAGRVARVVIRVVIRVSVNVSAR